MSVRIGKNMRNYENSGEEIDRMKGLFVIGTDTGVGKTLVCAGILKSIQGVRIAQYWKPVQTGTIHGDDTTEVKSLSGADAKCFLDPVYRFPEPLSPFMAAKKWGKKIELDVLKDTLTRQSDRDGALIIEGAGGLLVPYDIQTLQLDFIKASGFPVLIVGRDKVGVINQALLNIKVLQEESIPVAGIVLTHSVGNSGNAEAIKAFSDAEVLLELQHKEDKRLLVAEIARSGLLSRLAI